MRLPGLTSLALTLLVAADLSAVADRQEKKKKVDPVKEEVKKLQGTWEFNDLELNGRRYGPQIGLKLGSPKLVIKGNQVSTQTRGQTTTIALKVDPKKKPKEMNAVAIVFGRGTSLAIYVLEGDTLKICMPRNGNQRPTDFNTRNGNTYVLIWKRAKS